MKPSFEDLKQELKNKNISMSYQRLKVLEYITENRNHPTVDQIYTELHKDISTLSKTTVYNTLKMLAKAGLVKVVSTEDNESRYDAGIENHGHFKCESCGTIYDFSLDIDSLNSKDLSHFRINEKNVYFRGVCQKCLANITKTSEEIIA